jgi:hypothetical protein
MKILTTILLLTFGISAFAQTKLEGTLKDTDTGEPIVFGNIVLFKDGKLLTGTETDFEGYYSITELVPGTYNVEFLSTGYASKKIIGVVITDRKANKLDAGISSMLELKGCPIIWCDFNPPYQQDNMTIGSKYTGDAVRRSPFR